MRPLICIAVLLLSFKSFAQEVSEIIFQENKRSKTAFLQNLVELRPGMTLDSTQLERDVNFMIRLAGVSHAYYQVHPKADGTLKVVYGVQDNFTLIPQLNVYTTNDDEFAYRVGLYEYNFLGRNITIGGFYQDDIFSSFGLNFRAPNLFSRKFGLALNYGDITTLEPVFLESGDADYRYNNTSVEALALYQFNFFHSA
ncbi:POTRA domain-containing protein, partial [Gilvibacter sp.]